MNIDWPLMNLADVCQIIMGQSPPSSTYNSQGIGLPFYQGNCEFGEHNPKTVKWCSQPVKIADVDDILLSVRAPVGDVNICEEKSCIGRGLAALRAEKKLLHQKFLFYSLKGNPRIWAKLSTGSTFQSISKSQIENLSILLPPLPEQRKIATILLSVDNAIEKTKSVIEQTKVLKKGMMQELLTRGIPGRHKRFKKTPIGEIPEEWEVVKLKDISSLITSGSRGWARFYSNIGPIFLRIGNLTRDHINLRLDNLMYVDLPENNVESFRTATQNGDILISVTADLGIIGVVPSDFGKAYVNQHIALVRIKESSMNSRYVGHFLSAVPGQLQFKRLNDSGSKSGLNLNTIASLKIAKPKKDEQDEIARVIDNIDTYIDTAQSTTVNLNYAKSALMQALLTGEVRVKV